MNNIQNLFDLKKIQKYLTVINIGRIFILLVVIVIIYTLFYNNVSVIEKFENEETPTNVDLKENTKENYSIYRSIINMFNGILSRNPNTSEVLNYYKKINNKEIDTDKLQTVLKNTDEYKRTEAIQNNLTSNQVVDSVNEKQVNNEIIDVYTSLFNKNPDQITIDYFRKIYIEDLDLNKVKLEEYMLKTPEYIKYGNIMQETEKELQNESKINSSAVDAEEGEKNKDSKQEGDKTNQGENDDVTITNDGKTYIIQRPNIFNFYSKDKESEQDIIDASSSLIQTGVINATDSITAKNINEKQGSEDMCKKLNDDTTKCTLTGKTSMAKHIQQRNLNELRDKCKAKNYSNADSSGKLFPEFNWMVPMESAKVCTGATYSANPLMDQSSLIGTILSDATNTEVGSVLPKFTYKEEGTSSCDKKD